MLLTRNTSFVKTLIILTLQFLLITFNTIIPYANILFFVLLIGYKKFHPSIIASWTLLLLLANFYLGDIVKFYFLDFIFLIIYLIIWIPIRRDISIFFILVLFNLYIVGSPEYYLDDFYQVIEIKKHIKNIVSCIFIYTHYCVLVCYVNMIKKFIKKYRLGGNSCYS